MSVLCTTSPDHLLYPLMENKSRPDPCTYGRSGGATHRQSSRLRPQKRRPAVPISGMWPDAFLLDRKRRAFICASPCPHRGMSGCDRDPVPAVGLGALYYRPPGAVAVYGGAREDDDPRRPNSCAVHGGRLTQRLAAWREGLEVFNVCPGLFRMWNNAASLSKSGPTGRGGHHVLPGSGPPEP